MMLGSTGNPPQGPVPRYMNWFRGRRVQPLLAILSGLFGEVERQDDRIVRGGLARIGPAVASVKTGLIASDGEIHFEAVYDDLVGGGVLAVDSDLVVFSEDAVIGELVDPSIDRALWDITPVTEFLCGEGFGGGEEFLKEFFGVVACEDIEEAAGIVLLVGILCLVGQMTAEINHKCILIGFGGKRIGPDVAG